jgi:hypothetical protein
MHERGVIDTCVKEALVQCLVSSTQIERKRTVCSLRMRLKYHNTQASHYSSILVQVSVCSSISALPVHILAQYTLLKY